MPEQRKIHWGRTGAIVGSFLAIGVMTSGVGYALETGFHDFADSSEPWHLHDEPGSFYLHSEEHVAEDVSHSGSDFDAEFEAFEAEMEMLAEEMQALAEELEDRGGEDRALETEMETLGGEMARVSVEMVGHGLREALLD